MAIYGYLQLEKNSKSWTLTGTNSPVEEIARLYKILLTHFR